MLTRCRHIIILAIVLVAIIRPERGETRSLQVEDYLKWEWVTALFAAGPQISPDGKTILYQRKQVNTDEDRFENILWSMDADGENQRALMAGATDFIWSPDSRRMAYVAKTSHGNREIFVRDMRNGSSVQLTHQGEVPSHLSWSPDGKWIAYRAFVSDTSPAWDIPRLNKPEDAHWVEEATVIDRLHWQQSDTGFQPRPKGYSHIFVVPANASAAPRQLTQGNWQVGAWWAGIQDISAPLQWPPNSQDIIFSADREPDADFVIARSSLYRVNVATSDLHRITSRPEFAIRPKVSPDGKKIVYIGMDETAKSNFPTPQLRVINLDGLNDRVLVEDTGDFLFVNTEWANNGLGIYYNFIKEGTFNIHYVSLDGETREITSGAQSVFLASVSRFGVAVGARTTATEPGDIVRYDLTTGENMKRLTAVNDDILQAVELGRIEEIWYDSTNNKRIQGWIVYPPDFDPAKQYPLVLYIHGGPEGMYTGDFFSPTAFAFQDWAAQGYVVLYTNPRGSIGYGSDFTRAIYNAFPGQGDFDDLMHGIDEVVGRGFIDEERLYVTGLSGGGALTSWVVTQTDRFAAAAALCPITNHISASGTSDFPTFLHSKFKQPFWIDPQTWLEHSPIMHVDKVETPTLIMVGEKDLRTPVGQSQEFYTALKMRGVPTKLILMKDEGHATWMAMLGHPSNFLRSQHYLRQWFSQWRRIEGEDGPEWVSESIGVR